MAPIKMSGSQSRQQQQDNKEMKHGRKRKRLFDRAISRYDGDHLEKKEAESKRPRINRGRKPTNNAGPASKEETQENNTKGVKSYSFDHKEKLKELKMKLKDESLSEDDKNKISKAIAFREKKMSEMQNKKKIAKYMAKYQKVKFFEKVKIQRKLKQTIKALEKNESQELQQRKQTLLDDLRYVLFFPSDKKYISLNGTGYDDATIAEQKQRREEALRLASESSHGDDASLIQHMSKPGKAKPKDPIQSKTDEGSDGAQSDEDDFFLS